MEAAARELEGFKRFKGLKGKKGYVRGNAAKAAARGLVQARARFELEGFKRFKGFKEFEAGQRRGLNAPTTEAMCRQRAGCNAGTAKADGQRAWWKLPRGSWRVLRVLRVLSV